MSSIKSEPVENQTASNDTFQQELISSNGKTTIKTAKLPISNKSTESASFHNSTEPSSPNTDPTDVEKIILELCKQHPDGISDQILQNGIPNISSQQRLAALNRLLSLNKLDLIKSSQSGLLYRLKDLDAVMKGSYDADEKLIYSIIRESGNKGIWIREITIKTNLKTLVLNKILKSLESKKLIKAVTSVNASKKKVYMLFDLEPDRSLTGGSWYSGKDYEGEFVDVLNEHCYLYLLSKKSNPSQVGVSSNIRPNMINDPIGTRNATYATTKEIADYIKKIKISNVELNLDDIDSILNTLIFDGKVERSVMHSTGTANKSSNSEHVSLYRAVNSMLPIYNVNYDNEEAMEEDSAQQQPASNAVAKRVKGYGSSLIRVPCGICPVINDCSEDGPISPKTCIYMKEWLEF